MRPGRIAAILLAAIHLASPRPLPAADTTGADPASRQAKVAELLRAGTYTEAEQLARSLLAETEAAGGAGGEQAWQAMNLLVEALWRGGKVRDDSRELGERLVQLSARLHGEADPRFATSLAQQGNLLFVAGEFPAARTQLQRALAIRRRALGAADPAVAQTLIDLGKVEESAGDLAAARLAWEEALSIHQRTPKPDQKDLAAILGNLARVVHLEGGFTRARSLMEQSTAIKEAALGPDHPDVARSKSNFSGLLMDLGDYAEAERMARESLAVRERTIGPDHPQTASSIAQLARALYLQGRIPEAIQHIRRSIAILEKALGPAHPRLASNLNNLGLLLQETGDLPGARALLERAAAIQEQALGSGHIDLADTLDTLGGVLLESGELQAARSTLERALSVFESAFGPLHRLVGRAHINLAEVMWVQGDGSPALAETLLGEKLLREQFDRTARELSEREALRYEATRLAGLNLAISILSSIPGGREDRQKVLRVWNEMARSRARVLGEMAARRRAAAGTQDPQVVKLIAALDAARKHLASLTVQGPGSGDAARYREELAQATLQRDRAERALAESSAPFRIELAESRAGIEEIQAALPRGAALVAHVAYDRISWKRAGDRSASRMVRESIPSYAAFVLGGEGAALMRDLGPAEPIEALVDAWRSDVSAPPPALVGSAGPAEQRQWRSGEQLRRAFWDPVSGDVAQAAAIYWVPDGALHLINIGALPEAQGRYLVESLPLLHVLSTERRLLRPRPPRFSNSRALLVGSPSFDAGSSAPRASGPASATWGTPEECAWLGTRRFDPIPGSLNEVREIEAILSAHATAPRAVRSIWGDEATEEAFSDLAPGYQVLHLATHGIFHDGSCESSLARASSLARKGTRADIASIPAPAGGPMILAGLALAGANHRSAVPVAGDDGILTAEEVLSLDLSQAEWVVLSACATALGRVQSGEGVLGLQRAFELAGADAVIMSLWNVSDEATRDWMRHLYAARLEGKGAAESVRRASQAVLASQRRAGRTAHPFLWGAFVAAGD